MKMGVGLLMVTLGAILRWAVDSSESDTVNVPVVGLILMIVGAIAFGTSAALEFMKRKTMAQSPAPPAQPPSAPYPKQPPPPAQ